MKWGQNFLIDEGVAERQINYASISKKDSVLEIGPGYGILTKKLARKAKHVIAIEIDETLLDGLRDFDNVELVHADILKMDLSTFRFNKIVSNLPYDIASPLTFRFFDLRFDVAVLMYQREFAERLVAGPGNKNYSRLTVTASLQGKWQILEHVAPEAFSPRPKIYSSIVRFIPSPSSLWIADRQVFEKIVTALFSHRRKNVRNALLCESVFSKKIIDRLPHGDVKVDKMTPGLIVDMANKVVEFYEKTY